MVTLIGFTKARFLKCLAGFSLLVLCGLRLHADAPATGTIDLRQPANLKMIFDGGLRPYRLQGLESSCGVFDRANLTVILPNASSFTFEADRGSIHVLAGNEISSIDLFGLYTTVPDAVNLTKTICQAWGVSTDGLDETVVHLGTMPGSSQGWGQAFRQPKIRAQVIFKPMYYIDHVGAYVNVCFDCGDHFNGVSFLTKPIQPPPGYENVSMAPPPFKPSGPPVPAMSFEEARAKVQAALSGQTNQTLPPPPPSAPAPKPAAAEPESTDTGIPFWKYGAIVIGLALIASLGYFKLRKDRNQKGP